VIARVRHLDHYRVDHRQIGGDRHPVIEEPRVIEPAVLVVYVLLVQRTADPLHHPALDLALDIGGVDRFADILGRDKAQDRHLAGLGVDLDITELG
jgi:hypothetical protein